MDPADPHGTGELGRTAVRGTAIHSLAQVVTLVAGYVVAVVLGRELGPELYGVYGIVISVLVAVELIGRLGIPQATSKLVAEVRDERRAFEQTSITLTAVSFLAIGAAFFAGAPLLARAYDVENGAHLFRIAAIDIPFYGMFFCLQHVLNGQRRFVSEGLGVSLYGVSKALGVLALLLLEVTVEYALIANAAASVIGCAYFATRLSRKKFRLTLAETAPILKIALPTTFFILGQQLLANLDLWFLKWVGQGVPDETVGHYVAANNIARLPSVAYFVMMAVLIPTVSRAGSVGDTDTVRGIVRGATRFLILTLVPACTWLALRSEALMALVYADAYLDAALLQSLLVLRHGVFGVLLMTFCSVLIALGEPRRAALQVLQLVPVGALLNVLMIQARGAEGAALAALITLALGVLLAALALRRHVGAVASAPTVARALVATALLAAVLSRWSVTRVTLLVELPLAAAAYAVLLVLLRAVTLGELKQLARNPLRRR